MSETIKWSFSADKCFRRCQRQYLLQYLAAWHSTKDPVRKEAFLLKQVKTPELWHGNLIHRGLELFVVPELQAHRAIDWARAIQLTSEMAKRQFAFSSTRSFREDGMTKAKVGDDYCALGVHELAEGEHSSVLSKALEVVECSLTNLSEMQDFLSEIEGKTKYWPELKVRVSYDAAAIEAHIDLLFFKEFGKPTIIDWKISESQGGGDADLQTALYAWALCQHPTWRVERPEDCELLEVQLLRKTVLRHRSDQATFDRLEDRIYRGLDQMLSLTQGEKFTLPMTDRFDFAMNPNSCGFCSMKPLCQSLARPSAVLHEIAPAGSRVKRTKAYEQVQSQLF